MEQAPDIATRGVHARRHDVRARTFAARTAIAGERYETPVWLERSFVLPVEPEDLEVPDQPAPEHDLLHPGDEVLGFVRPETPEIDFAAVVRREDARRRARRTAVSAFALALLTALASLVLDSPVILPTAMCLTLIGVGATLWVDGRSRAPIPLRG